MTPKLLTPAQVSEVLGICQGTLNNWRATKRVVLPYVKIGTAIRYREEDIAAFINANVKGA